MTGTERYPWAAIKREYLEGSGPSLLAEKYGMDVEQIYNKIKRDKWAASKNQLKTEIEKTIREEAVASVAELKTQAREMMALLLKNAIANQSLTSMALMPEELKINPLLRDALKEAWKADLNQEAAPDKEEPPGFIVEPDAQD